MWNWLERLLNQAEKPPDDERILSLERETQSLRLELEEQEQLIATLKQELERQRSNATAHATEVVQTQIERLLADVAAPVAQLLTQVHLLEIESKPIQARDVLVVAKRFIHVLEDNGLTLEGHIGQTVPFDPDHHQPLRAGASLSSGQPVEVRFVGVAYQGKLLRQAGVTEQEG